MITAMSLTIEDLNAIEKIVSTQLNEKLEKQLDKRFESIFEEFIKINNKLDRIQKSLEGKKF